MSVLKTVMAMMVVLFLITGCAGATPSPAPQSPSPTPAPPTATAAPPTETQPSTRAPTLPTATPQPAPDESSLNITYTCNDGFIIAFHGRKVLVDALFREPDIPCYTDPEALAAITRAEPPFDGVDLILISHAHPDHFDPQIVGTFLQNNPQAALVTMGSVIDELKTNFSGFAQVKDRVHSVQPADKESAQITIRGIDLEIINAPADVPNLGFLIQIGGVTLFHTGDSGVSREMVDLFQAYHLPDKRIDFAFVPWQYLGDEWYHPLVEKGIRAKNYAPMHYAGDDAAKMFKAVSTYYPQAILFRKTMQSVVYSPPAPPAATPTPPPMPAGQPVSFTAEDGVKLAGALYPAPGDTGVVLAHMGITDQKSWQSFAGAIAGRGCTALTFDFRCYGLSDCGKMGQSESLFAQDTRAAIRFLRGRGVKRIVCMGASMGGTACMNAALHEELAGMVVIASPAPLYMGKQYPQDLVNLIMPKLFIVTEKDRFAHVVPAIYYLYDRSPGPKKLGIFPGTVHGTELFATQFGPEFRGLLTRFMEELATPVAKPTATPAPTQAPPASRPPGQMLYKDSFESGISQWQQRVGTVNHTTSQYRTAPGAAKMATAKPDGSGGYSGTSGHCIDLGSEMGILPGAGSQKDVTFEAYLKSDESIMAANLGVYFHTAQGCKGTFTTDTSPAGIGKGQDWTLVSSAGAIPDTTRSIDIVVHAVGVNSSAAVYIDDIQVYLSGGDPAKP